MKIEDTKKGHSKSTWIILGVLLVVNVILAGLLFKTVSVKKHLEVQFSKNSSTTEDVREEINIELPQTIYVASGITMEIYNSQVTSMGENITKYNILWNCEVGENLERKFSITADENNLGTYELSLEVYDNQLQLIKKETCTLEIVKEDVSQKVVVNDISNLSELPQECMQQVKICVDTVFNGTLDALKPEGEKQMQDVVYSVLCGL